MAGPTVKNSAYNSKPSNSQPRFAASKMFHWWRLEPRYHGCDAATVSVMAFPLPCGSTGLPRCRYRAAGVRLFFSPPERRCCDELDITSSIGTAKPGYCGSLLAPVVRPPLAGMERSDIQG